jgi:hypothetical protein
VIELHKVNKLQTPFEKKRPLMQNAFFSEPDNWWPGTISILKIVIIFTPAYPLLHQAVEV